MVVNNLEETEMDSIENGSPRMTITSIKYNTINFEEPPYGEIEYKKVSKTRKYRMKKY